ncbi:MBL fold metallo-hydrolase [Nitratireductor sp. GCM10026969]|uniref:MBL fold metallo-hydrolase n=1 Tax=Nitratireductor sp. GCM10026969 TaxID=3252645 RepID=UPI0036165D1B
MRPPEVITEEVCEDLPARMARPPGEALRLYWLGQAGFVIEGAGRRLVVDPYLSESLAEKYRGTRFPHIRMMPPPVTADGIAHVDAVLSTHAHTDHLDPGTLPALMAANPQAVLVAPASAREKALERSGIAEERLVAVDAGERREPLPGLVLTVTRAAHESLERDADGRHLFLGMAVDLCGRRIFHSGDTVPFPGQAEEVAALRADLALLPVNGRDAFRAANGVPGNMDVGEAVALARATGIGTVIAHHFDLFAFNTVPRETIGRFARHEESVYLKAARLGVSYRVQPVVS